MSPDTPALRGFLAAIAATLDVPLPARHADDDLHDAELTARAEAVRVAVKVLLDGPLDNCAIQALGFGLNCQAQPVHYQARVA
jgi:hypothetical protein